MSSQVMERNIYLLISLDFGEIFRSGLHVDKCKSANNYFRNEKGEKIGKNLKGNGKFQHIVGHVIVINFF